MQPDDYGRIATFYDRLLPREVHCLSIPATALVLCRDGARRAADLSVGDIVIARDRGHAPIRAIEKAQTSVDTVLLSPDALGEQRPARLTLLDAAQPVLVRNWRAQLLFGKAHAMARAGALCDGEYIRALGKRLMNGLSLGFDAAHVIYVNGLELGCKPSPRAIRPAA